MFLGCVFLFEMFKFRVIYDKVMLEILNQISLQKIRSGIRLSLTQFMARWMQCGS